MLGAGVRAYVIALDGLGFDRALLDGACAPLTPEGVSGQLVVPLDGAYLLRGTRELVLEPGTALTDDAGPKHERWCGRSFRAFVVEWAADRGAACATADLPLSRRDLARARSLAERVERDEPEPALLADVAQWTRGLGIAVSAWSPGEVAVDRTHQRVADALSSTFSQLSTRPNWPEFAARLGASERQARVRLERYLRAVRMPPTSFRSTLRHVRVNAAVSLLGAPDATVAQVAASLGYGSDRALILALQEEGLPAPSEIRRALRDDAAR